MSTIQGNFLSTKVRDEVKHFLCDPAQGRPIPQAPAIIDATMVGNLSPSLLSDTGYVDLERRAGGVEEAISSTRDASRVVDIVLSDMSAPWDQTAGFWKKSLSNPYIRMMNTSGIGLKDHVGSMVCKVILL